MNVDMIIEREIIAHLLEAPTSLRPVLARRPKASVYRALGDLRQRGLVVPGAKRGTWALSVEGERVARADANAPAEPPVRWPSIDLPQLALMPSREHRALAELVLLAAGARKRYERHHASFLLYSSQGLKGKTWLAGALAHMLGADPATCVLHAGAERGAGLTARRKSSGEVAAVRRALAGPLLVVDEFGRARGRDVRSACELLIHGDRSVPLEEQQLEVRSVVMLLLNSPKDALTPEEATGLDAAMLRRCFAVDMSNIALDASFARDGEERLERVASMGAITLPEPAAPGAEAALRGRIADLLPTLLDGPERMGSLDLVLLGQLAAEATAWVPVEDAAVLVVRHACVVWSTLGWVQTDWEERLAGVVGGDRVEEPVEADMENMPVMVDSREHDWLERVARLDDVARVHGLGDPDALAQALEDGALLRGPGRRALLEALDEAAIEAEDMIDVIVCMRRLGLSPVQTTRAIEQAHALAVHADPGDMVEIARTLRTLGWAPGAVARWVTRVAAESGSFVDAVDAAEREITDAEARAAAAQEQAEVAAARVLRMTTLLEDVRRDPSLRCWLRGADDRAAWVAGERVARRTTYAPPLLTSVRFTVTARSGAEVRQVGTSAGSPGGGATSRTCRTPCLRIGGTSLRPRVHETTHLSHLRDVSHGSFSACRGE